MSEVAIEIACDADSAYALFCEIRRVPEWVSGVASVDVLEVDDRGRVLVAHFVSMPARGSVSYTARYAYSDEERCVRWEPNDEGERALKGEALFVPLGPDMCSMRYALAVWHAATIPAWARSSPAGDSAEAIVEGFRRFVLRNRPAAPL